MYLSRFKDLEASQAYLREAVPYCEALCAEAGEDKWLMGTEELTLLDLHCGAMWDSMFVYMKAEALNDCFEPLNLEGVAPKWCAYMERLRAHPKIAPVCMNLTAANNHATRSRSWREDEKC